MALGADSAAIDTGSPQTPGGGLACPSLDQRSQARPVDGDGKSGARCDIGAYELQSPYPNDLAVSIADAPDPVRVGQPLTYTVTVVNNGPATATGVTLTDTLPGGVTFDSASPGQGSCTGTTTVTCTLGTLAGGASTHVTIAVTPTQAGSLTSSASVSGSPTDSSPGNNTATATTTATATCQPRPNVRVTAAATGPGLLTATIDAQTSAGTPSNSLSSIRITSILNATVQINGSPVSADQTVSLPGGTAQASLSVQRQTGGQASTVAFVVTDACGEWKSFVGGGPGAF
jgi:uncharacterized repeat protein (TIGR01451 family)